LKNTVYLVFKNLTKKHDFSSSVISFEGLEISLLGEMDRRKEDGKIYGQFKSLLNR
jgi:hypothetical protein